MKSMLILGLAVWLALASATAADFDIRIPAEFHRLIPTNAVLKKLAGGMKFTEGPVWMQEEDCLIFSNIPDSQLKKWREAGAVLSTFRENSHSANGNCVDRQGRLLSCEMGARDVVRTEKDGSLTILIDRFEGKRFNAPNDLVVKSDNTIYFTDPDYGLPKGAAELPGLYVYRLNPDTKKIAVIIKDCDHPNGICFSPDEKKLYIADSGAPHHIKVYDVQTDGTVANGRVFCVIDKGVPDGIRCDEAGRVFSSAGDGVQIFSVNGELIGKILVPECPANLAFGGRDGHTLYITARTSLYSIPVSVKGAL